MYVGNVQTMEEQVGRVRDNRRWGFWLGRELPGSSCRSTFELERVQCTGSSERRTALHAAQVPGSPQPLTADLTSGLPTCPVAHMIYLSDRCLSAC